MITEAGMVSKFIAEQPPVKRLTIHIFQGRRPKSCKMAYSRTVRILAFLPLAILASFAQDRSQGPPPTPTFKSVSRMVLVDVLAIDKDNKPIHDLRPSDFTVLDAGKQQSIVTFEERRSDASPKTVIAPNLPDGVYTNYVARKEPGALTVLLLDSLNTDRSDLPNARNQMLHFLGKLPAGEKVALYTLGSQLRMVQSFTENSDELIAAAQRAAANSHPQHASAKELAEAIGSLRESAISTKPGFSKLVRFLGEEYEGKLGSRTQATLDAFTQLARALAAAPGRKNLIWISSGFPFDVSTNAAELRQVAGLLAASHIAVYPVDVRGVVFLGADAQTRDSEIFSETPSYESLSGSDQENESIVETMKNIASITGGRAYFNTNNLDGAIADSMRSGSSYYSLSYRPATVEWNGKFHKITIKTSRPNVKLLYRSGYYATPDGSKLKEEPGRAAALAMQPDTPVSTQLIMKARVVPPKAAGEPVGIDILIDISDLRFVGEMRQKEPDVQFMAVAWDTAGKQIASVSKILRAPLTANEFESLLRTGLQVHQEMTLNPGSYQLRLGVMDRLTGQIGTLDVPLTIHTTPGGN
jgi:VWFA-related protein